MIVNYFCNKCCKKISKIYNNYKDIKSDIICNFCNDIAVRTLGCPTSNTVEIVDNGFMERSVEYDEQRSHHLRKISKQHSYQALNNTQEKL